MRPVPWLSVEDDASVSTKPHSGKSRGGAVDDVVATWRSVLGDRADVLTRDDAAGRSWFGALQPAVRPRIGDVVVACRSDHAIVSTSDFSYEATLIGLHGSLTAEEMLIPLLVS